MIIIDIRMEVMVEMEKIDRFYRYLGYFGRWSRFMIVREEDVLKI